MTVLGSGAFFGGAAAFWVGGLFDRDFFSLGLEDLSTFSFEGLAVLDAVEVAFADLDAVILDGVGGVAFAGGGTALALNCSNGLGHAPIALGVSSTGGGGGEFFFDLASALEVFEGIFGSGGGLDAGAAFIGGPFLPVATGGGGEVVGTAVSPNSCRARSFTLGNMVYESQGELTQVQYALACESRGGRASKIVRHHCCSKNSGLQNSA